MSRAVTQDDIDAQVAVLLADVPDGDGLTELQAAMLRFALDISATSLAIDDAVSRYDEAVTRGATPDQLTEIVTLMAAIGVHSFFEGSRIVAREGGPIDVETLDPGRRALWDRHIGERRYWIPMREEIPGFLESLLLTSPAGFEAFVEFAGLPFRTGHVDTVTKELIGMAADASTSHRYLPGMRMHLRTAARMGASSTAIRQALHLAAASSPQVGVL